jgi:hypothetical protein
LYLQKPFDIVLFFSKHPEQVLYIDLVLITMNIAPIGPVITTSILLNKAELLIIGPVSGGVEVFHHNLGLHVDLKRFGFPGFGLGGVEEGLEHGLVGGGGAGALVVHDVVEVCPDLVAALTQLDYRKRHFFI